MKNINYNKNMSPKQRCYYLATYYIKEKNLSKEKIKYVYRLFDWIGDVLTNDLVFSKDDVLEYSTENSYGIFVVKDLDLSNGYLCEVLCDKNLPQHSDDMFVVDFENLKYCNVLSKTKKDIIERRRFEFLGSVKSLANLEAFSKSFPHTDDKQLLDDISEWLQNEMKINFSTGDIVIHNIERTICEILNVDEDKYEIKVIFKGKKNEIDNIPLYEQNHWDLKFQAKKQ